MKIGIHTWGSEGDLRPFFVLAEGLAEAGHEVRLAYCAAEGRDYSSRLEGARFAHQRLGVPLPADEMTRMAREVFADRNPVRQLDRVVKVLLDPVLDDFASSASELAKWADLLVLHMMAHPLAAAGELEKKPMVCVYSTPMIPTRAYPPPGMPNLGALNRLTWMIAFGVLSKKLLPSFARIRARFGLPPIRRIEDELGRSVMDLVVVSPTLLPRPADWPAKVHVSGFLSPKNAGPSTALDAELEAFLAAGPAPVYVTFGSMTAVEEDPAATLEVVERAVAKVGCRAIVQSGVSGVRSQDVFRVGASAHDQLFPRCSAIVHHGGVGTTQSALRAGRPSVVVAHMTDQYLWGRQLQKLGVAPPHLTRQGMEPGRLARALEVATTSQAMRERAESLGQSMRAEDGLRRAVELIELAARAG